MGGGVAKSPPMQAPPASNHDAPGAQKGQVANEREGVGGGLAWFFWVGLFCFLVLVLVLRLGHRSQNQDRISGSLTLVFFSFTVVVVCGDFYFLTSFEIPIGCGLSRVRMQSLRFGR